jgi:hypothetical protein
VAQGKIIESLTLRVHILPVEWVEGTDALIKKLRSSSLGKQEQTQQYQEAPAVAGSSPRAGSRASA